MCQQKTGKRGVQATPTIPAPSRCNSGRLSTFLELKMQNVMLNEEDFKCLVRGGVLTVNKDLRIALQDIGFFAMNDAVISAMRGTDILVPRDKEND